ncbi:hypothetical protein XELAEV_18026377mg [Xenopus laevis]|uniref:Uncharacterized protein n=1 Tax=Xenopus laevis TaxID=8355 RepID=A0A974CTP7_XENLA|nr:hypothetical protein XELAEV_18026377mg [Xenopus laevis]
MVMDCSESQDIDEAKDSVQTDYSMPHTLCSNTQDMKTVTGSLDSVSAEPDECCLNGNPSINDLNDNAGHRRKDLIFEIFEPCVESPDIFRLAEIGRLVDRTATDGMFSARRVRESPVKKIGSQDGKISVQIFVGEINIYGQQSAADHGENKQMKRKHGTTSKEIESKCKRAMRSALRDVGNNAKENGS